MKKGGAIKLIVKLLNYCTVILSAFFLFNATISYAEESHLLINEVYPNPATGEIEWIELYNPTSFDIDLSVCSIEDATAKPAVLKGIIGSNGLGGYKVLNKGTDFTFALNNDAETVILKCNSGEIDKVIYGKLAENAPVPGSGQSISRIPNGVDTDIDKNDFRIVSISKGSENILPSPIVYSDKIIISEILPSPADGDVKGEFIELYNTGDSPVDICNWQLDDIEGGSSPFTIINDCIIEANRYIAYYYGASKLNNSGEDSARLLDPLGNVKSMISYDNAIKGKSYSMLENGWAWTSQITPNGANVADLVIGQGGGNPLTISEAKKLITGTETEAVIMIGGFVTAVPGQLSLEYFYIQDASGGIQIYKHDKSFPALAEGDFIEVFGIIYKVSGEYRIKISDPEHYIHKISEKSKAPELPKEIPISDITDDQIGEYIEVTGVVTQTSGDIFTIADSKGKEIKVVIREGTNIDKPAMKKGDTFQVAGVLSTYNGAYRILPFKQEDVKIVSVTNAILPRAGAPPFIYPIFGLIVTFLWNIFPILKRKL